jgi:cholesterol transport system auxiliary component
MNRMPSPAALFAAAAVAATLVLTGCGVVPGTGTPPRVFVLSPKTTYSPDLPKADWQLTVDLPVAEAGLNNQRIALQRNALTLEYYADANWVDTAPAMVQRLLVESFENTGKIVAVGRQSVLLRSDFNLLVDLREFQAEYNGDGPPKVHVRLNGKLVRMPQRTIIGAMTAEFVEPAKGTDLNSVVDAFDEALGKTMKRLVEWTIRTASKAEP